MTARLVLAVAAVLLTGCAAHPRHTPSQVRDYQACRSSAPSKAAAASCTRVLYGRPITN